MSLDLPMACFIAALAIGVAVEGCAWRLGLWTYRNGALRLINILLVFGLLQGFGVGWIIGGRHALRGVFPVLFMVGAVIGLLVEGLNEFRLHAWTWPERPLLGIGRPIDKAAVVGVAWGFAPMATVILARLIIGASLRA